MITIDGVIVEDPETADKVVEALISNLDIYGVVTLADFYQLVSATPKFDDYMFGWKDLSKLQIIYSKGEYSFDLPSLIRIK